MGSKKISVIIRHIIWAEKGMPVSMRHFIVDQYTLSVKIRNIIWGN